MHRRDFLDLCGAAAATGVLSAEIDLVQADTGKHVFSNKYEVLRTRFLKDFEYKGQIVHSANGSRRKFGDQTLHMGFALLTFSGEAQLLKRAGRDPGPSEAIVRRILNAFDRLDRDAEKDKYGTAVAGFFLRDYVKDKSEWAGHEVASDFLGNPGDADMSLDQVVHMLMGWWAVSHWSTDEANRKQARAQADRVMDYLCHQRFWIDQPHNGKAVRRGDDVRGAAGFLCDMGEQITGEDYYHRAKVRLSHDNQCHTCAGSGQINVPNPNLECIGCSGTGNCKIVVGGGRCEICRGTGDVKIVTESNCPTCSGTGEIRVVVTDFWGHDHTIGKSKCRLCGGDGKIGGKTTLGKCKICGGDGKLPEYTKDLGKCKLCGGSGRMKGELPKMKCPVCGGSKELNLYVTATHPLVLGLSPLALVIGVIPKRITLNKGKIAYEPGGVGSAYSRNLGLICMAFEDAVPDPALLLAAKESSHPFAVALRAARAATVCPACHGHGKAFVMVAESIRGSGGTHLPGPTFKRHEMGTCKLCNGKGIPAGLNPHRPILLAVQNDLVALFNACPVAGPGDRSPSKEWCKSNRWERCTDLNRDAGDDRYNGIDFLCMEVVMRLAGAGDVLPQAAAVTTTIKCEFTNSTKETVAFRLNGGTGLTATLAPGKTASYTVVVDAGVPPAVFLTQKDKSELTFALKDGGQYAFVLKDGKIMNAFK